MAELETAHATLDHTGLPGVGGGGGGSIATDLARRVSGSITLNSTSEADVDTGIDLVVAAAIGDTIVVMPNGLHGNEAVIVNLDVATIVAGSPVNYFGIGLGGSDQGLLGWSKQNPGVYQPIVGAVAYVVQGGDISGGNVTLRLRYKTSAAVNSTLFAAATLGFQWAAMVLPA